MPLAAKSSTSLALTSSTTTPRRASAYLITTSAASFSSISLPVRSETQIVFLAVGPSYLKRLRIGDLYAGAHAICQYAEHREEQKRLRVVAFAFLAPFFFIKGE